jgi:sugar/nucleoside kinase (ribokinase family)
VVGLGLCVRDDVFLVDDFGLSEGRTRWRAHGRGSGGMVANALVAAAGQGARAEILSLVGRDADGDFVASALRGHGVSTRRLVRSDRHPTTTALVLVEKGSGRRRFVVPDRRALERSAPDFDLAPIRRGALLLVDGHFPAQARRAVRRAGELGVPVIADFADARPAHRALLPHVDFAILPMEFVRTLGVGDARGTLRHLHDRYGCTPVITQGEKGALALLEAGVERIPAPRVRALDTTGAGDVFHGAFAAGLAAGLDVRAALRAAARAAARSCRQLGGSPPVAARARTTGPRGVDGAPKPRRS